MLGKLDMTGQCDLMQNIYKLNVYALGESTVEIGVYYMNVGSYILQSGFVFCKYNQIQF